MKKPFAPRLIPWSRPVPVKKSQFFSLKKSGEKFSIETDLAQIGSFRSRSSDNLIAEDQLLLSDLQLNVFKNSVGRLGSGRSGFFACKYLKGCGLTPLAANWNDPDPYHNSGHMLASAAIREYMVTCFLKAKVAGDSIVNCDGVLCKKLSPELKGSTERIFEFKKNDKREYSAKVDFHLQGLTYKEGNFARASNIVWHLQNLGSHQGYAAAFTWNNFFEFFSHFLNPNESTQKK